MPIVSAGELRRIQTEIFVACGAPPDRAGIAADELLESSLLGYDSHGVMRCVQYAKELQTGFATPAAPIRVVKETATTATVDCAHNFGAVAATVMADIAADKAVNAGLACVVSLNCLHVGRLGAWVTKIAARGCFGMAFATNTKRGHFVVPFGGREGRLGSNPIAYGVPVPAGAAPIVFDMATCIIPEGKIRVHLQTGKQLPSGHVLDPAGNPTTEPKDFYGPPRGSVLPFGGAYGHKGYGLALMADILGGLLAGYASSEMQQHHNGLCLIAINPDMFCGRERFVELVGDLSAYVTSAPPADGFAEVVMPGTLDYRLRELRLRDGVPVPDETWRQLCELATTLQVACY